MVISLEETVTIAENSLVIEYVVSYNGLFLLARVPPLSDSAVCRLDTLGQRVVYEVL